MTLGKTGCTLLAGLPRIVSLVEVGTKDRVSIQALKAFLYYYKYLRRHCIDEKLIVSSESKCFT
jgi:hypothetical protein